MSFRLFIYYCALAGGWSAFVGWMFGRMLSPANLDATGEGIRQSGIRGMFLGLAIALGLSFLDAVWNLSLARWGQVLLRVLVALLVGAIAGLLGGMFGQWLYGVWPFLFVFAWTLVGLLVGVSIAVFELLASLIRQQDVAWARKKLVKALLGGTVGGFLGGMLALLLRLYMDKMLGGDSRLLWSPTCWGFVALGMCIGLLVGLAQVILKEAWLKVEAGFRPGREMILAKDKFTIGRAEACDLGLFGDNTIEKLHAQIVLDQGRYYIEDTGTPAGTYVNDRPVGGRTPLNSGDLIRIGKSSVRFNERQKRTA
jgi:hypothetical protein